HHRRVGGEDGTLRDRARGAADRGLWCRDRRAPGRAFDVRHGRAGRTGHRLRYPHAAVPAGDEVHAIHRAHCGSGQAHAGRVVAGPRRSRTPRTRGPDPHGKPPMAEHRTFHLPDLGEGLPDATIVEWYVKPGDTIRLDEILVSMETAKAVVDVPSPVSGKVLALGGAA